VNRLQIVQHATRVYASRFKSRNIERSLRSVPVYAWTWKKHQLLIYAFIPDPVYKYNTCVYWNK